NPAESAHDLGPNRTSPWPWRRRLRPGNMPRTRAQRHRRQDPLASQVRASRSTSGARPASFVSESPGDLLEPGYVALDVVARPGRLDRVGGKSSLAEGATRADLREAAGECDLVTVREEK